MHTAPSTSKNLYYMDSRCYQIRKNVSHIGHVGRRHRRDVQLRSRRAAQKQGVHFMRHPCIVRSKKISALLTLLCLKSALVLLVRFLLRHFASSQRVLGGVMALLQYLARITFKPSAQ